MGLKLRYHLFHGVDPGEVYDALSGFYEDNGGSLQIVSQPQPDDARYELRLHERDADWTVLDPHGGWEDETRRKAQLHVSRILHTAGVLVYVYDGDYWLYELFANGVVLDHSSRIHQRLTSGSQALTARESRCYWLSNFLG